MTEAVGLVAGNGQLPLLFAKAASRAGLRIIAAAHKGETDPAINDCATATWVRIGQLGKIFELFAAASVKRVVFAGGIRKVRFLGPGAVRPDARGVKLLAGLRRLGDDALLRAIADGFVREGFSVEAPTAWLSDHFAKEGAIGARKLSAAQSVDVEVGLRAATQLGAADIGQTVVVRRGVVVAVEAIEGTDACIRRGAALGGAGCVVVKRAKPKQDLRFDVPAVGAETLAVLREVKVAGLAVEAGRTILLDEAFAKLADRAKIAVVGVRIV